MATVAALPSPRRRRHPFRPRVQETLPTPADDVQVARRGSTAPRKPANSQVREGRSWRERPRHPACRARRLGAARWIASIAWTRTATDPRTRSPLGDACCASGSSWRTGTTANLRAASTTHMVTLTQLRPSRRVLRPSSRIWHGPYDAPRPPTRQLGTRPHRRGGSCREHALLRAAVERWADFLLPSDLPLWQRIWLPPLPGVGHGSPGSSHQSCGDATLARAPRLGVTATPGRTAAAAPWVETCVTSGGPLRCSE